MNTIERLKAEALADLASESKIEPETTNEPVSEQTEIIATVTTFEDLQKQFEANNNSDIKTKVSEALNNNNFTLAQQILSESKQSINKQIFELPKYFLYQVGETSYLVQVPETVTMHKESTGTRNVTFECPFKANDQIQLVSGEIKSDVYTFQSEHAVLDQNGNVFKPSQLVGAFMEHQLNKKVSRLKSGKGYNVQGISSPYWTKL